LCKSDRAYVDPLILRLRLNMSQQMRSSVPAGRTLVAWVDQVLRTTKKPVHGLFDPLALVGQHPVTLTDFASIPKTKARMY
jgi:hypothetical protein